MNEPIERFRGKNFFLSNFFNAKVVYGGVTYSNNEAAFQAQKCQDEEFQEKISKVDGATAKKMGRKVKLRKDWEEIKDRKMYEICYAKFVQNTNLRRRLLDTGDVPLEEVNKHGDKYWGIYCGQGENKLGKILMRVRGEL